MRFTIISRLKQVLWRKLSPAYTFTIITTLLVTLAMYESVVVESIARRVHSEEYAQNHSLDARLNAASCDYCHSEQYCTDCHDANAGDHYHKPGYIAEHNDNPYMDQSGCYECHDYQSYCVVCHSAYVGYPSDHLLLDWSSVTHATQIIKDSERCIACHSEPVNDAVCMRCHTFISPHNNSFADWLEGDATTKPTPECYTCHKVGELWE